MKKYEIVIQAKITKTVIIFADSEQEAAEAAHSEFSVLEDGVPENYEQDTLSIAEIKE